MKMETSGTKKTRDKQAKKSQIDEQALNISQEYTVKYDKSRKFALKKSVKLKT